jgi:hypothetical protein
LPGDAPIEIGGVRWWLEASADAGSTARLVEKALDTLRRGEAVNLKLGWRKQLYPLHLTGRDSPDHLLKVYVYPPSVALLRILRPSKSRRELHRAAAVVAHGLPAPLPLAAGEERRGGCLRRCFLLMPILEGVTDLRRLWFEWDLSPAERRRLATAFGDFSRRIHDAGFQQDDYAPNNFLVRPGTPPGFLTIDFERARLVRRLSLPQRRWMLTKFDRAMIGCTVSDRMRFLRAYAGGSRSEARRWWRRIEAFSPRLARRDFRRMRRNCVEVGRHFKRVSVGEWRGYARRDARLKAVGDPARPVAGRAAGEARVVACPDRWRVEYGPVGRRARRQIWTVANTLWQWGRLVPKPLAIVSQRGRTAIFLERAGGDRLLSEVEDPGEARGPLRVLIDRLAAVAEIDPPLAPGEIGLARSGGAPARAVLLAPHKIRFHGLGTRDRARRAAALAEDLLRGVSPGASEGPFGARGREGGSGSG